MPEYDAEALTRSRWRNPVFLGLFVPGAVAWLAVVGWLVWMCFKPVMGWVGQQHPMLQEILDTVFWVSWLGLFYFGLGALWVLALRVARLPPANENTPGQTAGKHAGWKPPRKD